MSYPRSFAISASIAASIAILPVMGQTAQAQYYSGQPVETQSVMGPVTTAAAPLPSTTPHINQFDLLNLVKQGRGADAFEDAQEHGDSLFARQFVRTDGVGANVENGNLFIFTRVPRADLKGPGEWFNHFPPRQDGPNGQSCVSCHNQPVEDGGGTVVSNINRDPFREGILAHFVRRNAPHTMGMAGPQLLAEEMTAELKADRDDAISDACYSPSGKATEKLNAKGIDFGKITVTRTSVSGKCKFVIDNSKIQGVDSDLVIKPFQWKGTTRFIREFSRGASHTEMGVQPDEILVSPDQDGDFDGFVRELSVGDMTAFAIYNASQPRPVTRLELDDLGLDSLSKAERKQILRGQDRFQSTGCAVCHAPTLTVNNVIFREPSRSRDYRDSVFPAGQQPLAAGLDPAFPVSFDITRDQPDNIIRDNRGRIIARLGSFETDGRGHALINLYSDLKRHDLGAPVAEPVDETASPVPTVPGQFQGGIGTSVFLTRPLWGAGSTSPYMQDGNSTTLTEAIMRHGGEAADSRARFQQLSDASKDDLIAFINNLVLFKEEEGAAEQAPTRLQPTDQQMYRMR
jgi:hypothetical protein